MKVVAVNGSPRPEGNTYFALKEVTNVLEQAGIETEILHVGHKLVHGCIACGVCFETKECVFTDKDFQAWTDALYAADGILLGSPVYYSSIAGTMKAFLDRAFYQSAGRMRHKVGASVAVARRAGTMPAFDQLNYYMQISEMLLAPSYYWHGTFGMAPGDMQKDDEGVAMLRNLGQNMTWMLQMKGATKEKLPPPAPYPRERTNFIR